MMKILFPSFTYALDIEVENVSNTLRSIENDLVKKDGKPGKRLSYFTGR